MFGEDQIFTDMNDKLNPKSANTDKVTEADTKDISSVAVAKNQVDPREYRPIEVIISITMHDLQAHLIKVNLIINYLVINLTLIYSFL